MLLFQKTNSNRGKADGNGPNLLGSKSPPPSMNFSDLKIKRPKEFGRHSLFRVSQAKNTAYRIKNSRPRVIYVGIHFFCWIFYFFTHTHTWRTSSRTSSTCLFLICCRYFRFTPANRKRLVKRVLILLMIDFENETGQCEESKLNFYYCIQTVLPVPVRIILWLGKKTFFFTKMDTFYMTIIS